MVPQHVISESCFHVKFSESFDQAANFWTTYSLFILIVQRGTVYSSAVDVCHAPESRASSNVGFGLQAS